jgi:peptidoglycan/xylan/chitin deacetylase (PgdA/CDA1 family)
VTTTPGDGLLATSGTPPAAAPAAATAWPGYVKASVAWHLAAGAAAAIAPTSWPWALGAVAANHLALTAGGLWPRSRWLGSNWTRLPAEAAARREIAITIDDGPDPELTPAILDLLDEHRARATFFCIAERARVSPALCRKIVARGHSVENHSDRHSHRFSLLGPRAMAREIAAAQASLADITGVAPRFFRAPAGLRNPFLAPVLQRLDLQLVSWTRRGFDTVGNDPAPVLARLLRRLGAGDILLLHDGHGSRDRAGRALALIVLPALLDRVRAAGLTPVTLAAAGSGSAEAARSEA